MLRDNGKDSRELECDDWVSLRREACAGDPFTPELIGPSAGHWGRQPGEYGKLAFFTTDGGTASPPAGGPKPARLVKVELLTKAAVR
jgi:hypothetical protein